MSNGYVYASIESAPSGFGMYQVHPNRGDDVFDTARDLISYAASEWGAEDYVATDDDAWRDDSDDLVAAIAEVTGSCYDEPEILVAMRNGDGEIVVFGVEEVEVEDA